MPISITREDAKKLGLRPLGKKHPVRLALEHMEAGEIIYITRADFQWKKKTPLFFINQITKASGKKFIVSVTKNKQGWQSG